MPGLTIPHIILHALELPLQITTCLGLLKEEIPILCAEAAQNKQERACQAGRDVRLNEVYI